MCALKMRFKNLELQNEAQSDDIPISRFSRASAPIIESLSPLFIRFLYSRHDLGARSRRPEERIDDGFVAVVARNAN